MVKNVIVNANSLVFLDKPVRSAELRSVDRCHLVNSFEAEEIFHTQESLVA